MQGRRVRVRGANALGRAGVGRGELGADEGHEDALLFVERVLLFANIEQVLLTRVTFAS